MQSLYTTQTDNNNSNVKYLNNVQLQVKNLQQQQLYGNKINAIEHTLGEMKSTVDNLNNTIIDELRTAVKTNTRSDLGEAFLAYFRQFYST